MIAFHYPPGRGSSGLQRTLGFSRYLPEHGWGPVVLTVKPSAHPEVGGDQLGDIPAGVPVTRVLALDTARHLAMGGRYPGWLSIPDRWATWLLGAVPAGLRLVRRHRPEVIWSTYPIATAHLIAYALHRLTGRPWVADFRDPMTEVDPLTNRRFPADQKIGAARRWIERLAVRHAARLVFVSPSALALYRTRYPEVPDERWALIPNGYDESAFAAAEAASRQAPVPATGARHPLTLLHSGILYPTPDRDPTQFFMALRSMASVGAVRAGELRVVLRATGHDAHYRRVIAEMGVEAFVTLEPPVGYREALREMLSADGLLVFQGRDSNTAIPAKLYEYLRARRPILALVDDEGDTAALLRELRVGTLAPLTSSTGIATALSAFLATLRAGTGQALDLATARRLSREAASRHLAELLYEEAAPEARLGDRVSVP
jgi:hypothetical protein